MCCVHLEKFQCLQCTANRRWNTAAGFPLTDEEFEKQYKKDTAMKEVSKALRNHINTVFADNVSMWISIGSMTHAVSIFIQDDYIQPWIPKIEKTIEEFMTENYPSVKYKISKVGKFVLG